MPSGDRSFATGVTRDRAWARAFWPLIGVLFIAFAAVPYLRNWREREARIETARAKVREIAGVVRSQGALDTLASHRESELALRPQRVLRSRSRALAASALQSLVQEMAEASNVTVTRLDVANIENRGDLPITLSANGDIFGLAELLRQVRTARFTVIVDKLQTQNNSALRGAPDVLQISMSLHAPVIVQ